MKGPWRIVARDMSLAALIHDGRRGRLNLLQETAAQFDV